MGDPFTNTAPKEIVWSVKRSSPFGELHNAMGIMYGDVLSGP